MTVDRTCLLALWIVEQALHDCQYVGSLKPPQLGLRLALAHLYGITGDDPGVARSSYARTEYARIRRMVRFEQTVENDERLRAFMAQ